MATRSVWRVVTGVCGFIFSMCSTAPRREELRTSVITGHCMPEGLEGGAKSVCCQWNTVSLCLATVVSWGAGGLTYGFAILDSCSAVMPRRTGLLDRRRRGSFVVCRKRGLGCGGPGPGRKEKEPKERGSFRHRWLPGGIYPTETRRRPTRSARGEKRRLKKSRRGACGRVWLEGQTARSTGSRWKLRIELTPSPVRSSVYRTLVGFFGAQSAAGVGLGVGVGVCEWAAGGDAFSCVSLSGGNVAVFKCYPSMPGPNLGASQIGLVLVDVPFVSCALLKKGNRNPKRVLD